MSSSSGTEVEIQTCPTGDDTDASEASETKRTLEIDPRRCTTHQKTYTNALERAGRRSDHITRFQIDPERLQGERNGHVDETIASGGSNCLGTHRNEQEASRAMVTDTKCGDAKRTKTTCGGLGYFTRQHPITQFLQTGLQIGASLRSGSSMKQLA